MHKLIRHIDVVAFVVVFALTATPLSAADSVNEAQVNSGPGKVFPQPGEWPCFRGNSTLDGHAAGQGEIREPKIAWRFPLSSTVTKLALLPLHNAKRQVIAVPPDAPIPEKPVDQSRWFTVAPTGNIAGKEQPIEQTQTVTYADVLPQAPGLEKLEFESGFAIPTVDGQWQYGPGRLQAWRGGKWENVWETEPIDHCFCPYPLTGDFDGDGRMEVAVIPWKALLVYDAATGELEHRCEFTDGRSYGFFGVYDFDRDGKSEFLVMADFAKHIDVLGYRDGKLTLLWQAKIEMDIARPEKIMRVLPEPVVDLDNDGRSELLVNLYNIDGDSSWNVVVYDAVTGDTEGKLKNEIVQGFADLDGDGVPEILTAATNEQHVPFYGVIRVYRFADGGLRKIWEEDGSAWQCHTLQAGLNQQNWANHGHTGALVRRVDGKDRVVVRHHLSNRDEVELSVRHWDDHELRKGPSLVAAHAEAVALDKNGAMLVDLYTPPSVEQPVEIENASMDILSTAANTKLTVSPPAVVRAPGENSATVVALDTSSMAWSAFTPPSASAPGTELWRIGRGFDINPHSTANAEKSTRDKLADVLDSTFGPTIAAPIDDGARCLIVAGATRDAVACIAAIDMATGRPLWNRVFEQFAAGGRSWNCGGPLLWQSGEFTQPGHQDVLVTILRDRMHSEETFVLNGRTGSIVWHRDKQIADRAFGGQPFAIADFNGNGLDDLASFYPDLHYIADGATGKDLLAKQNYWPEVPLRPVYWGQPIAGQFDPNSKANSLLFTTYRRQMIGRVHTDGSLAWSDAYDTAGNGFPAIGDFDGDGSVEAIFIGFEDGIRCYDAATGARKWTLDLARQKDVHSAVSGDIDGDGKDEAIFVLDDTLYCVGTDKSGHSGVVEWELKLPTSASSPILADVTNKADRKEIRLSILITGSDGYVYCIDSAAIAIPGTAARIQH